MSIECTFPWTGMVINPQGNISVCCAYSDKTPLGHINDIDDLNEFFLEDSYTNLRQKFKNGYKKNPACIHCVKYTKGPLKHSQSFTVNGGGLQYLELTTSNICNQTCATCSSKFSSKWSNLNEIFGRVNYTKAYSMTNRNIDTIIKALPNLKEVQIKGGEPFSDMKNLKIINALSEVNPECTLKICSNFQMIPKAFMIAMKNIKNLNVAESIDGVGARYNWIRGGNFDKVIKNMEWFYQETGSSISVNPCVSVYNIDYLREIWDYFKDKDFAKLYSIYNIVEFPKIHAPQYMLSQEEINNTISRQFDDIRFELDVKQLYDIKSNLKSSLIPKFDEFTDKMNKVRGFSL